VTAPPAEGTPPTDRELAVLELVTRRGGSVKQAARELGVSARHVRRILSALYAKLNVDNQAQAVRQLGDRLP